MFKKLLTFKTVATFPIDKKIIYIYDLHIDQYDDKNAFILENFCKIEVKNE